MVVKSIYYKGKRVVSFCGLNKTYLLRIREFIQPTGNRRIALRLLMAASAYPISLVERFFGARDYFFEEALEELYRGLNEKPVALFAIWAQDDSKFRASVYYYTKERIRFCKIGFSEQDLEDFQNELTISRYLAAYGKWGFYIPSNIDGFFGRSVSILSFDCLPPRLTIWRGLPVSKRNLLLIQLQSLTGVQITQVNEKDWWKSIILHFNKKAGRLSEIVKPWLIEINKQPRRVSFAHGDLGSENVFEDCAGNLYLIDWERARFDAPYLTDYIGIWLGSFHEAIINADDKWFISAMKELLQDNLDIWDVILALLYIASLKFRLAEIVIERLSVQSCINFKD